MKELIPVEVIQNKILLLRGEKVMLDADLSARFGRGFSICNLRTLKPRP